MFLMYVDESGDPGLDSSPTRYFVLSGLVIHESRWNEYLERLVAFRRRMRTSFGLLMREEFHAARFINRPGPLSRIPRNDRVSMLRFFADELGEMRDFNLISIVVDKSTKSPGYAVFDMAWRTLIQRFENTMGHCNFRGSDNAKDWGLAVPDATDVKRLTELVRQMRRYNPIPNQAQFGMGYRNLTTTRLVEDPYFKRSDHSYFIQACDLAAFLLYQELSPSAYARKKGVHHYFNRLAPIFCLRASSTDPRGVVRL